LLALAFTAASMAGEAAPKTAGNNWDKGTTTAAEGSSGLTLDEKQTAILKHVNGYFNDMTSLKGGFVQVGADKKRMRGKFAMKKPGKFRFDYSLPSRQVIISDGEYLQIADLDLNNEDRVALDQTPFRLLLRKDVDLMRDARILEVQEADDLIILSLQDKNADVPGRIKLFMATKPALELKEWITTDAQGGDTHVEVSDVTHSGDLDAEQFKIQPVGLMKGRPQ
jgi:outer membrane lipoprotein-sorting protein